LLLISPCFPPHAHILQEWAWAHAPDGTAVTHHGQGPLSELPPDGDRVLVLPTLSVSWHRVQLPKTSKHKQRAVLEGLLEDRLLDDVANMHFALGPNAVRTATDPVWVAACNHPWLRQLLNALEQAQAPVQRIIPEWAPPDLTADTGHRVWVHAVQGEPHLSAASNHGVFHWPLVSVPPPTSLGLNAVSAPQALQGLATPETLSAAEAAWPQAHWGLHSTATQWLQMAQTAWDLAQFDVQLAQNRHAGHRLQHALRQLWRAPVWQPVRWGLATLAALQIVGLNAMAWNQQHLLQATQQQTRDTLQKTFPHITLVLDAPLQMERELAQLRQAQGQTDAHDFEALLHALGQADLPAWQSIQYEARQVTLRPQVSAPQVGVLQTVLSGSGWQIGPADTAEKGTTRLIFGGQP
jgi:general secretion pathway protein L